MQRLIFFIGFVLTCTFCAAQDSLLQRKWFFCATQGKSQNEVEIATFKANNIQCDYPGDRFYWEFRQDHTFVWYSRGEGSKYPIGNSFGTVYAGWINISSEWNLANNILTIGEFKFVVDVLDEDNLLIHCEKDQ